MKHMNIPNAYTLPELNFVGGSTQELVFHCFFYKNKEPFDLSSCSANFSLVNYVNKRGEPLVSKDMKIGFTEIKEEEVCNELRVTLVPSDTVDLVGKFIYQITIRDASGDVDIPNQGLIHIINNINKEFAGHKIQM